MAKPFADRGRVSLPHPPEPVGRRTQRVRRRDDARPARRSDKFRWFLGGWIAHARRGDGLLRADGQLVQALRRRVVGADAASPGARQPHRRLPRRRRRTRACASSAASPAPTATRTSPTPRCSPPGSTASPAASSRPPMFDGDVYAATDCRACPRTLARRDRACSPPASSRRRRSATTSSSTTPTSSAPSKPRSTPPSSRRSKRRHRLGAASLLRTHLTGAEA